MPARRARAPAATEPRPIRPPSNWKEIGQLNGFHKESGFTIDADASGGGVCVVGGVVRRQHLNINGVVHGGVYATILDTAMGGAVVSVLELGEVTATTSLYVEFLRPAQEGHTLRAEGRLVRRGHHLAFVEGKLTDGEGRLLSQAHGTWYIWSTDDATWSGAAAKAATSPRR